MQLTLLRVLQEHEIRPVGATENVNVDVRIVAATNDNLERRISSGHFREDLYYRLSVIPLELPPLRDRLTDIPLLVSHFVEQIYEQEGRRVTIDDGPLQCLQGYSWPGNVRELENVISRATALCDANAITLEDLPDKVRQASPMAVSTTDTADLPGAGGMSLKAFLRSKERDYIHRVLEQHGGDKEQAAKSLGVSLATFYRKYGDD